MYKCAKIVERMVIFIYQSGNYIFLTINNLLYICENAVKGYVFITCMEKEGYICIANCGKRYFSFKKGGGWSFL